MKSRSTDQNTSSLPHEGEWSVPMPMSEIARRMKMSPRKCKLLMEQYGLARISKKAWIVRVSAMDRATRHRIETGHSLPFGR